MNSLEITIDMLMSLMLRAQNPRLETNVTSRGGGAKQTADDTERAGLRRKTSNKLRPQMKCFFLYGYTKSVFANHSAVMFICFPLPPPPSCWPTSAKPFQPLVRNYSNIFTHKAHDEMNFSKTNAITSWWIQCLMTGRAHTHTHTY